MTASARLRAVSARIRSVASKKRLRWRWGPLPARAAEKAAAISEAPERAPARKDKKHWCKGKEGREHAPEIVLRPWMASETRCHWQPRWDYEGARWRCIHAEVCSACGKVLRDRDRLTPAECPGYPGSEAQRAAAEQEAAEVRERIAAYRNDRRRPITGPQGYRRRRGAA